MHALRRTVLVLSIAQVCACASGCGLKGPLYIPTAEEERELAERKRALEERERREREEQPASTNPAPPQASSTEPPARVEPGSVPTN
jgi:predicted small lipoprotein YifL